VGIRFYPEYRKYIDAVNPLHPRPYAAHLILAMLFGFLVRFWLLWDKPFWRDEAWVAYLIRSSYAELLISQKPIPAGFAMLIKLIAVADFIPAEILLRLPPLLAGIGIVALVPGLIRLMGGSRPTAVLATWLAAGCQPLIYYSRELKHYSLDTFLWLLGAYLVALLLANDQTRRHRSVLSAGLALMLCAAPWLSFGSLFPLVSILVMALIVCWRQGWSKRLWGLGVCLTLYLGSFVVVLMTNILSKVEYSTTGPWWHKAQRLFSYEVLPSPDQVTRAFKWFFIAQYEYLFPFTGYWLLPLVILGLFSWTRSHRAMLLSFIVLTTLLTVAAALTNHYILVQRTLLFVAPVYLAAVAQGAVSLWRWAGKRPLAKALAGTVLAGLIPLSISWGGLSILSREGYYRNKKQPYYYYDQKNCVEPALGFVASEALSTEPVLFMAYAGTQYLYYDKGRLPQATHWYHTTEMDQQAEFTAWLKSIDTRGWLVFLDSESHSWLMDSIEEQGLTGKKVLARQGSNVWLIESVKQADKRHLDQ